MRAGDLVERGPLPGRASVGNGLDRIWQQWSRNRVGLLFLLPSILPAVAVTFYPVAYAIRVSLYETSYLTITRFAGLRHYIRFLGDPLGQSNIVNSFVYTFGSLARASAVGKQMAIAPAPGVTADKPQPAFTTGKFIVMTKDCKEREAAGLFIETMISPEAQLINAKVASELPIRASVLKDAWFDTPEAADMKLLLQYMKQSPRKFQYHPKNNVLGDLMASAFQSIVAKRASIRDALDDVARRWEAEVKGA